MSEKTDDQLDIFVEQKKREALKSCAALFALGMEKTTEDERSTGLIVSMILEVSTEAQELEQKFNKEIRKKFGKDASANFNSGGILATAYCWVVMGGLSAEDIDETMPTYTMQASYLCAFASAMGFLKLFEDAIYYEGQIAEDEMAVGFELRATEEAFKFAKSKKNLMTVRKITNIIKNFK